MQDGPISSELSIKMVQEQSDLSIWFASLVWGMQYGPECFKGQSYVAAFFFGHYMDLVERKEQAVL